MDGKNCIYYWSYKLFSFYYYCCYLFVLSTARSWNGKAASKFHRKAEGFYRLRDCFVEMPKTTLSAFFDGILQVFSNVHWHTHNRVFWLVLFFDTITYFQGLVWFKPFLLWLYVCPLDGSYSENAWWGSQKVYWNRRWRKSAKSELYVTKWRHFLFTVKPVQCFWLSVELVSQRHWQNLIPRYFTFSVSCSLSVSISIKFLFVNSLA